MQAVAHQGSKFFDGKSGMPVVIDDGGRQYAGFKGSAGDCVTRAICNATGLPYRQVYDRLAAGNATQRSSKRERSSKGRNGVHTARLGIFTKRKWFKDYMSELGFEWHPTMEVGVGCSANLIAGDLPDGVLVVKLSKHLTCVKNGVIHDTYDPQRQTLVRTDDGTKLSHRCVYGYWQLKRKN